MESILTFKNDLGLVTETKTEEESLENDIVHIGNKFYSASKKDPLRFWRLAQEYYQPKTIQNQTSYLNKIFPTQFVDDQIKEVMSPILENTQQLQSLLPA
ncbi:hypothetical protein O181_124632 [Austropuccinia psidii MF-1]|uniref:Uncharacterized protein n=1 Tax=Austropuccinia psidii MF-1 TaxID=1389203 RepID=A0A9Q3Q6N1_9BASI|nr:hypothetical protein [Austropuccinia psidii MF-1]